MTNLTFEKAQVRDQLRKKRRALGITAQHNAARCVAQLAAHMAEWESAQHVAVYLPNDGELDTGPLCERARSAGKTLLLPVIRDNILEFAHWELSDPLTTNRFAIEQPSTHASRCARSAIDIIFLPLVGWDRRGGRLGMGGGFYDRYLAGLPAQAADRPLLIGLAHDCQEVPNIPCESHDIRLDRVLSGSGLTMCQ